MKFARASVICPYAVPLFAISFRGESVKRRSSVRPVVQMPRREAQDIASTFSAEIKAYTDKVVAAGHDRPKLVGFLANDDKAAVMYARWTEKACTRDGVCYELRRVEKHALEAAVIEANTDPSVHGIMVYYPCFGGAIDDCEPPRAHSC